ncbi:hypothetical protein OG552_11515 [Streptomyces sp. NBC_01476]|uniref:hypothetical protein n=1 Tax=Streptomyces sp. NBC_01476 TaxID=2903881 RepID=UPI002E32BB97|nr:hypothetical protein [Streptomyces sp. NBC_01476]
MPPQHNPYAQPSPYAPQPAPPYYGATPAGGALPGAVLPGGALPGAALPGAPGQAGGRGGAGKAVLWAVVGAVVASALWGGGVLLLGKDSGSSPGPLHGYAITQNLCTSTDLSSFKGTYPQEDDSPSDYTITGKAVDDMSCSQGLEIPGSSYADAYLYVSYALHKKTDPGPEFTDTWLGYTQQRDSKYVVKPVSGFGDEAYLVTEDTVADSGSGGSSGSDSGGDRYVTLAVREGWMTFSMNWSQFASSLDADSGKTIPSLDDATRWVKTATTATLAGLKK